MKNKLMYLVAVLFAAFACFSCNDDNNKEKDENMTGIWQYGQKGDVHLEFESKGDIELPEAILNMLPDKIKAVFSAMFPGGKIPASQVKGLLLPYAQKQMQSYFRGINFLSDKELEILINLNGEEQKIKTTYEVGIGTPVLAISTQSDDFKKIAKIPAAVSSIDVKYRFTDGKFILYLDATSAYAQGIINMIPRILVASGKIPEAALPAVTTAIQDIFKNVTKFELGPILVR